jgi:hypothetical protein
LANSFKAPDLLAAGQVAAVIVKNLGVDIRKPPDLLGFIVS